MAAPAARATQSVSAVRSHAERGNERTPPIVRCPSPAARLNHFGITVHEFSLAESVIEQVCRHRPAGAVVRIVRLEAGPLRAIVPDAMQWAWTAATQDTDLDGAVLELEILPWRLFCPECQEVFTADDMFQPCACGCELTTPKGGDALTLLSLEVEQAEPTERNESDAGTHC